MDTHTTAATSKRRRWPRILAWVLGDLVVMLVAAYFVVTSAWFIKRVVLPKAGAALNAEIALGAAEIHPFSAVTLSDLSVKPAGGEPLLNVKEIRLRYRLLDILRGHILVDEVTVTSPTIQLTQHADGSTSLDPLLKAAAPTAPTPAPQPAPAVAAAQPAAPAVSAAPAKLPALDIKEIALTDAAVRVVKMGADGRRDTVALNGVNLTLTDLKNPGSPQLTLAAQIALDSQAPATNMALTARLAGEFRLDLASDLQPNAVKGALHLNVRDAQGALRDVNALSISLDCDLTPAEIRQLALRFAKAGAPLGAVEISGPFDLAQQEGQLAVAVRGIDRQVLNLAGALGGIDFNQTALSSTNRIEIAQHAQVITVNGQLAADRFSVTQKGQTTPALDLAAAYHLTLNQPSSNLVLRALTVTGRQGGNDLLRATLSKPMWIDWSHASNAVDESAFELTLNRLNLADWRAFAADLEPAGVVSVKANVTAQQAGQALAIELNTQMDDLAARAGDNRIAQVDLNLGVRARVERFQQIDLTALDLRLAHRKQPAVTLNGSGKLDLKTQDVAFQTALEVTLPRLAALLNNPDVKIESGGLKFNGQIRQQNRTPNQTNQPALDRSIVGALRLDNFTGQIAANAFDRLEIAADCDVAVSNTLASIRTLAAEFKQAGQPAGRLSVSGRYNLAQTNGFVALTLTNLNQNLLRSVTAAALGANQLASVAVNANVVAQYDPAGASAVQGEIQIADLLITDPQGRLPRVPMTMAAKLDAGLQDNVATIRQCDGTIRQGDRAGGSFNLSGRYNLATTNGALTLKLADLNQNTLRPFLASALGDKTLASVSINADANAAYDAAGASSVKADFNVANLVLKDPSGKLPESPLAVGAQLDVALLKQVLDLRQCRLTLAPTARAKNQLDVSGKVDLAKADAIAGDLKIASEALDLTAYYDLFTAGGAKATGGAASAPAAASGGSGQTAASGAAAPVGAAPAGEPPAVTLPFDGFTVALNIGRLYLREIDIAKYETVAALSRHRVALKPVRLTLNGASVNAAVDLNLGVPGYEYDLLFQTGLIPVEPLANSFAEPEQRGKARGDASADVRVKGAGITGANLRRTLSGQVNVILTNANIQLLGPRGKRIVTPIATVLSLPALTNTPISALTARLTLGNGKITATQCEVVSEAFHATTAGDILIVEPLTNSPIQNWPVNFALQRALAEKIKIAATNNVPAHAAYLPLPVFIHLKGTLGAPETQTDKLVIAGLLAKTVTAIPGVDKINVKGVNVGTVLKGVGGLLSGDQSESEEQPPAEEQAPPPERKQESGDLPGAAREILNLFQKPKR